MATLASLLALIPEGSEYDLLRFALQRVDTSFGTKMAEIDAARLQGWVAEIAAGDGRTAPEIRNDIFENIVGSDLIQEVFGATPEEATALITGETTFSDLTAAQDAGGTTVGRGVPEGEAQAGEGIGTGTGEAPLSILAGNEVKWYFDPEAGKWLVSYGLPNSERELVFEATPVQMDALFGAGFRPLDYTTTTLGSLLDRTDVTFGGEISEMEGEGQFEDYYSRIVALGLDNGRLPDWAANSTEVQDLIFIAQAENKSDEWLLEQISGTPAFQGRFPGIAELQRTGNLSLGEAVAGFLEFEAGVRGALTTVGYTPEVVSPALVGDLLTAGHSLTTINDVVRTFKRMQDYAPALSAFNDVLAQTDGFSPISSVEDMFDFVAGNAPADVYNLWEASSIREAAVGAGIGDLFTAEDALQTALSGDFTLQSATQAAQSSAEALLRLRHELNVGKFDLTNDELLDVFFGRTPRSGRSMAEVQDAMTRAITSAREELRNRRAQPFTSFSPSGSPQAASLANLRTQG